MLAQGSSFIRDRALVFVMEGLLSVVIYILLDVLVCSIAIFFMSCAVL